MNSPTQPTITLHQLKATITAHAQHADMANWIALHPDDAPGVEPVILDLNDLPASCTLCITGFAFVLAHTPVTASNWGAYFPIIPPFPTYFDYLAHLLAIPVPVTKQLCFVNDWPPHLRHAYEQATTSAARAAAMCQAINHFCLPHLQPATD